MEIQDVIANIPDGYALIESRKPGWVFDVDTTRLDMRNPSKCILGQLYGSYLDGRDDLGIPCGNGEHYGLDCNYAVGNDWNLLTEAWVDFIKAKRAE